MCWLTNVTIAMQSSIALNLTDEPQELAVRNIRREMLISTYLDHPVSKAGDRIHLRANEGLVLRESR